MANCIFRGLSFLAFSTVATHAMAQDYVSGQIAQTRADGETINNGTNPTVLSTRAGIQYQYNSINSDLSFGQLEAYYTTPIGAAKNMALEFTLPLQNAPNDANYGVGDLSVKFSHVVDVNADRGIAYTAELYLDTAERSDLGYSQNVLELSAFYAMFTDGGNIFAPAWVQTVGLGGGSAPEKHINVSTVDFYYVPKLANPNYFITYDPALIYDWDSDKSFASLQITFGMLTGEAFGGNGQIFVKPGIYAGRDRSLDYSIQVGYRVLNF